MPVACGDLIRTDPAPVPMTESLAAQGQLFTLDTAAIKLCNDSRGPHKGARGSLFALGARNAVILGIISTAHQQTVPWRQSQQPAAARPRRRLWSQRYRAHHTWHKSQ